MTSHCRLCHEEGETSSTPLVVCNNCGSHACREHYTFWNRSKNAFCHSCFPHQASSVSAALASALQILWERVRDEEYQEGNQLDRIAESIMTDGGLADLLRQEGPEMLQHLARVLRELVRVLEQQGNADFS